MRSRFDRRNISRFAGLAAVATLLALGVPGVPSAQEEEEEDIQLRPNPFERPAPDIDSKRVLQRRSLGGQVKGASDREKAGAVVIEERPGPTAATSDREKAGAVVIEERPDPTARAQGDAKRAAQQGLAREVTALSPGTYRGPGGQTIQLKQPLTQSGKVADLAAQGIIVVNGRPGDGRYMGPGGKSLLVKQGIIIVGGRPAEAALRGGISRNGAFPPRNLPTTAK